MWYIKRYNQSLLEAEGEAEGEERRAGGSLPSESESLSALGAFARSRRRARRVSTSEPSDSDE